MEAPKCKLCSERHYGMCKVQVAERPAVKTIPYIPPFTQNAELPMKLKPKSDYNAYMREYMRKRRAAEKALKQKT
jgi:hypothetical protein